MSDSANPYQAPLELGTYAATGPSAFRFVPAVFSLLFGLMGLCFTGLCVLGLMMEPMDGSLEELLGIALVVGIFGGFTAAWFGAAWFWYRARYILATLLTALGCLPIAFFVLMFIIVGS